MRVFELLKGNCLAIALCFFVTWLSDRDPPVDYHAFGVATEIGGLKEAPPRPGGVIPAYWTISRDRVCPTLADRRFRDSAGVDFNLENDPFTPAEITGDHPDTIYKYIPLPARVHVGRGTLTSDITWRCNPLHYLWPLRTVIRTPVDVQ